MGKVFMKVMEWLRRGVTATLKSEKLKVKNEGPRVKGGEVMDTQRVYENVNANEDRRLDVDTTSNSLNSKPSNEVRCPKGKAALNNLDDSLLLRIEEFVGAHYRVRLNVLAGQYEVAERDTEQWMAVTNTLCNRILMELNRAGIILAKPYLVKTVIEGGALAEQYHPVRSYLEALPAWDGTERIEALFRRVTDDAQLLCWLRKWFVALVAQVMGRMGTYGNSVCPILISSVQGWGKSQFAKLLVPPQMGGFFTDTFNLQQEDGCLRRMTAYMLINVDEIDRFGDRRMATFKNMVQLAVVSMKRAYHTQMEEKERMASFIATSNRRHLLNDESGSRRFICVELTHAIDVATPVEHDQLYAEALAALDGGERCWFDEEETRQLEAHNAAFAVSQGVWALMKRCLTLCAIPESIHERSEKLPSAVEVYDYLHHQSPSAMAGIERSTFGHYLIEFGAQQVRVRSKRVYGVAFGGSLRDMGSRAA